MNWFAWFLVITLSIFALSSIILGWIIIHKLKRRNSVRATIFLKTGGQKVWWIHRDKPNKMTMGSQTYLFDEKCVRKTSFRDHIYYYENVPQPIDIDAQLTGIKVDLSPEKLNVILEDNLLAQLFASKELQIIQLLIIICLVSGIISLFMIIYLMMHGVKIAQTEGNYNYLYNITRSALIGA